MTKALKTLVLIFAFCLLVLLTVSYFYEKHPEFKSYIDQSLISSIPYLWDLMVHIEHYDLKVDWVLYALIGSMIIMYKTGFIGVNQNRVNTTARVVDFSIILFVVFLIATAIIYFWPSSSINLGVIQFNKGANFWDSTKYTIDMVIIGYLYFFVFMVIQAINSDVKTEKEAK